MLRLRTALFVIVFTMFSVGAEAAPPDLAALVDADARVLEHFTTDDGLPVDSLAYALQTRDGYIWLASFDGLVRFDGRRFTVFNTISTPELGSNRIVSLFEAPDGALWILTEPGRFIRRTEAGFEDLTPAAWSVPSAGLGRIRANESGVWIGGDSGLFLWDGEATRRVEEAAHLKIRSLDVDPQGDLWIAAETGFGRLDENGLSFRNRPDVSDLRVDENGLFLATKEGLLHFSWNAAMFGEAQPDLLVAGDAAYLIRHPAEPAWIPVFCDESDVCEYQVKERVYRIKFPRLESLFFSDSDPLIRQVAASAESPIWVLSDAGLARDGEDAVERESSSFFADRDGSIWITTPYDGLVALHSRRVHHLGMQHGLPLKNVGAVAIDGDGDLLAVAGRRLARVDGANVEIQSCDNTVYVAYFDAVADRLLSVDDYNLLTIEEGECRKLAETGILRAMHRSRSGRLYLAANEDLYVSEPGVDAAEPDALLTPLARITGRPQPWIRAILEDRDGDLWLGSRGFGIARYREGVSGEGALRTLTREDGLPSDQIRGFHQDSDDGLWIATEDRGLAFLHPADFDAGKIEITTIDTRNGLYDNSLHTILEDARGWFWFSTNRGIFRARGSDLSAFVAGDIPRVESVAYAERDGMAHREGNGGMQHSAVRGRGGILYFATQDGVAWLDPARLTEDLPGLMIHFEKFTAEQQEIPIRDGRVELQARQRSFQIDFTAVALRSAERVRFRYLLKGYDDEPQSVGEVRSARYAHVPPGTYDFHVAARSPDGVWSETPHPLTIRIPPYFYETWWFRLLFLLSFLVMCMLFGIGLDRRQRRKRLHLEALIAERTAELQKERDVVAGQKEKLVALDQAKSRLFTHLTHEFRTPLTLILGPVQDLLSGRYGRMPDVAVRELERIDLNSTRLLSLIGQLLDLARINAGGLKLRVREDDLGEWVEILALRFVSLAERRSIRLETQKPDVPLKVYFDFEQIDKVVTNLLTNAFKFTDPGGRVQVSVDLDEERQAARIRVCDSGRGIAEEDLEQVFDSFYRAADAERAGIPGTGLGLALSRDLVELHGGSLEAESELGRGSTFTARFPLGRDAFQDDQIVESEIGEPDSVEPSTFSTHFHLVERAAEAHLAPTRAEESSSEAAPAQDDGEDRTTVLVVDDHPDIRAYLRLHLEEKYRVLEARSGQEAWTIIRERIPDLVISDVMMPDLDGFELLGNVRRDPETDWLPVILLTARAEAEDRLKGLGIGADDYLTKPFDMRELLVRVDNLIDLRRRLRDRLRDPSSAPRLSSPSEQTPELLRRTLEVIDENLDDEDFSAEVLAHRLAMSRAHFYVRLAEVTDKKPARLILERRIDLAAELLRRGDGAVSEIAYAVGFRSAAQFSRSFRSVHGTSPSQFRRQSV